MSLLLLDLPLLRDFEVLEVESTISRLLVTVKVRCLSGYQVLGVCQVPKSFFDRILFGCHFARRSTGTLLTGKELEETVRLAQAMDDLERQQEHEINELLKASAPSGRTATEIVKHIVDSTTGGWFGFNVLLDSPPEGWGTFDQRQGPRLYCISGEDFIRMFSEDIREIGEQYDIPPKLLASVLFTEMRNLSLADALLDSVEKNRSFGGAQLRAQNILNPDYGMTLGQGKSLEEIKVMLQTPRDMITLVAQGMITWDKRYLPVPVIDFYRNERSPELKAAWAGLMSSLKDTYNQPTGTPWDGSYGYPTEWQEVGGESWMIIDQWGIFGDD